MKYYSTNNKHETVTLKDAVMEGLAPDNGLYMPEKIPVLPKAFFDDLHKKTFSQIAYEVAFSLMGSDLPEKELRNIIEHTIQFEAPLVEVEKDIFALELFHGPTLAFKDFGARFMSQLLRYFAGQQQKELTILVATSGDTGSAVANGFLGVDGTRVVILYPEGKVSDLQEKQFTTLGRNIHALEIEGTFDDCQRLVKQAFMNAELKKRLFLTSANSINIARLIPQSFYYFYAFNQLKDKSKPVVFSVPSGNYGNLTGGLLANRMGLPVKQFIAATNANDIVPIYLKTQDFRPRPSDHTISNAMDVGDPSNFARLLDLFDQSHEAMIQKLTGFSFSDSETSAAMKTVYQNSNYLMDPHGAIAYLGVKKYKVHRELEPVSGIFLETAHPGKFKEVVEKVIGNQIMLPDTLKKFLNGRKQSIRMSSAFEGFKNFLHTF